MNVELTSPCKVNLLLNVLGRRPDGFHELETVLQLVPLHDLIAFDKEREGIQLTCSDPALTTEPSNLVHRAASAFLEEAKITSGVRIHLEKNLPVAAGLGGGSSNAAVTLQGLNQLFDEPLSFETLNRIAANLGSDVPFFLQQGPALGTGRGENIQPLPPFKCLHGTAILLLRPGFGISTPWAYQELARDPEGLNGRHGRAKALIDLLMGDKLDAVRQALWNSLEAPVFHKFPVLALLKEFFMEQGAAALMSGSGSTTFAIAPSLDAANAIREKVLERFGTTNWTAIVPL